MNLMGDYRYVNPAEIAALAGVDATEQTLSPTTLAKGLDIWKQHMQQVLH